MDSSKSHQYHEVLREYLTSALVLEKPEIESVLITDSNLLLAITEHDVAAFSIALQDEQKNYQLSYNGFKSLYSQRHTKWSHLTLSFVFCIIKLNSDKDLFCQLIEADRYFCRKYVIDAAATADKLEPSILRLPFLPLNRSRSIRLQRPLPAQDLLLNSGVDKDLAKLLSVVQQRSDKGVAKDCLEGKFKLPQLLSTSSLQLQPNTNPGNPVITKRLNSIEIVDFRAYKGTHRFDLNGDAVILYGPNGLGKTSIFDAIDFLCTGRVGRFNRKSGRGATPIALLRHLDAKEGGGVSGTVTIDSVPIQIERLFEKWSTVITNEGELIERKNLLQRLGCGEDTETQDSIENLERLFRSCHLFGQDSQELLYKFQSESQLEQDTVARMLALEDYVRASKKSLLVSDVIRSQVETQAQEIANFKAKISEMMNRKEILLTDLKNLGSPEVIVATASSIAEGFKQVSGVDVIVPEVIGLKFVRECQTLVVSAGAQLEIKRDDLAKLHRQLPLAVIEKEALGETKDRLVKLNDALECLRKKLDLSRHSANEAREKLETSVASFGHYRSRLGALDYAKNALERLKVLEDEIKKADLFLAKERKEVQALEEKVIKLKHQYTKVELEKVTIGKTRAELHSRLLAWQDINSKLPEWIRGVNSLQDIENKIKKAREKSSEFINRRSVLMETQNRKAVSLAMAEQKIDSLKSESARFASLLDQITNHVTDPCCPVCGANHESKENVLSIIRSRKELVPNKIRTSAEKHARLKQDLVALVAEINATEQNIQSIENEINGTQKERDRLREQNSVFELTLGEYGLPIEAEPLAKALEEKLLDGPKELEREADNEAMLREKYNKIKKSLDLVEHTLASKTILVSAKEDRLVSLNEHRQVIYDEAENAGVGLITSIELILTESAQLASLSTDAPERLQKSQVEFEELERIAQNLQAELTSHEKELKELTTKELQLTEGLFRYSELLSNCGFADGVSINEITMAISDTENLLAVCAKMHGLVTSLESMIKAASSSIELRTIESEIELANTQLGTMNDELTNRNAWMIVFNQLARILDDNRNKVVAGYTNALGSEVSVIQQRLRPVYGFGNISIVPAESGTIRALVERTGKQV